MNLRLILASIIFVAIGCKQKSTGPCDYYEYPFEAKLVDISPYKKDGKTLYHVALKFNNSSLSKDTQYLEEIKGWEIDSAFITRNRLKLGYKYKGLVSEIKDGNCTPRFISFEYHFKKE